MAEGFTRPGAVGDVRVVDSLPFVDMRDSRQSPSNALSGYSCSGAPAGAGAEVLYRLSIAQRTPVRVLVLDAQANAVGVHLLSSASAGASLESGARMVERTLDPGTYAIAVDGLAAGGGAEYTLTVTTCVAGGAACN